MGGKAARIVGRVRWKWVLKKVWDYVVGCVGRGGWIGVGDEAEDKEERIVAVGEYWGDTGAGFGQAAGGDTEDVHQSEK